MNCCFFYYCAILHKGNDWLIFSLLMSFVLENCIATLGQKSINHPKKCSSEMSIFTEFTLWKYHFFLNKIRIFQSLMIDKIHKYRTFFLQTSHSKKNLILDIFFRLKFFLKGYFIIKYLESWFELWKKALGYCQSPRRRNSVHINWDYSSFLEMMFCEQQLHFLSTYCKLEVTHRS